MRGLRVSAVVLALWVAPAAGADAQVELTPALGGWSRPGRTTEIGVRIRAGTATRGTLAVAAGPQTVRAGIELGAGETLRLDMPVASAATLEATVDLEGGPSERRSIALSLSESPLLGVAVSSGQSARVEGFHGVAMVAGDLPRSAAAYTSLDALALDAGTLRALDPRQLAALIGHAGSCGRIALVSPDPGVLRVLAGSAGCGARMLVHGGSLDEALGRLQDSLAEPATSAVTAADLGALARPEAAAWPRVVAVLATYCAVAALGLVFTSSLPVLLLLPLLATAVLAGLLHAWEPRPQLVVWAEAGPSARVAQYQAWQHLPGMGRGRLEAPVLAGLGQPRPCDRQRRVHLEFDAERGQPIDAAFDARLFESVALCYSGSFPVMRDLAVTELEGGHIEVRNRGTLQAPPGRLVAAGTVQDLPALAPGAAAILEAAGGRPPQDAAGRAALARAPHDGYALLWPLQLDTIADAPANAAAWLFVPVPGGP